MKSNSRQAITTVATSVRLLCWCVASWQDTRKKQKKAIRRQEKREGSASKGTDGGADEDDYDFATDF